MRVGCVKLGILVLILVLIIYLSKNKKELLLLVNSKIKNKNIIYKIIYILIILVIIICIILFCTRCAKFLRLIFGNHDNALNITDEKILNEQKIYNELINNEYKNQNSKEPYILEGFSYLEGTWDTGYVVQDENGNQFVWIPCTNKKNSNIEKLERINTSVTPFINYRDCYNENYEEFIKSALENGGFYISRYEIGKEEETPVSKPDVEVWTNINFNEAEEIAQNMYTNINCELINGYAYDTTLKWIEACSYIEIDSNIVEFKDNLKIFTGRKSNNNIYDFCDNVLEFSLENLYDTRVIRGVMNSDETKYTNNIFSKESRYCIMPEETSFGRITPITIRTVIYK